MFWSATEQPGEESAASLALRVTPTPLLGRHRLLDLRDVLTTAGPGGLATLAALHRSTHSKLLGIGDPRRVPTGACCNGTGGAYLKVLAASWILAV
jgi:hypothetical protein